MSLEKFQATDAWRNKFKNLLFTERKLPFVDPAPVPQRLSFELSEDLQVILEEKKIPTGSGGGKMPRVRDAVSENKENVEQRRHCNTPTKVKHMQKAADATLAEDRNGMFEITNTSFETLEDMCEKTASDPDSTLFRYLNRESTHQTRAGSHLSSYDAEADALQRLLDELNVEETEKRLRARPSMNITQLDDVEEPSKFWENTLTAETFQISPVKMVGLMRQSTIMEECSDVSESDASSHSYQSAMKTGWSTETTGCYETANDSASCSEREGCEEKKKVSINSSGSSSKELFQQRHSRQKFFNDESEKSLQLIDLETTIKMIDSLEDSMDEVNTSASNSTDSPKPLDSTKSSEDDTKDNPLDAPKCSPESTQLTESDTSSVIELSDDETAECDKILKKIEKLETESALNRSFTIKSEADQTQDEEKSIHFNDTMEEVEYMMKKGMQYMAAAKETSSTAKSHLTPVKRAERYRSPSPMLSSPATPKTVIAKPKPVNKAAMEIKPFPKLNVFKKPQVSGLRGPTVQNKFVSSVRKQQYAHVISPIGAYINKTPTTPLVSTIKPGCSDSTSNSKAFKQLEYDSRVTPQDVGGASSSEAKDKKHICSLPKKAYISSDYKHIVDERTQHVIPGGPTIQKYILPSLLPAVVRHEGKVKFPSNMRASDVEAHSPRRTDGSLAGLSMISGDVSVYTIKDAQKF